MVYKFQARMHMNTPVLANESIKNGPFWMISWEDYTFVYTTNDSIINLYPKLFQYCYRPHHYMVIQNNIRYCPQNAAQNPIFRKNWKGCKFGMITCNFGSNKGEAKYSWKSTAQVAK